MKVAIFSESAADEAALRVLVDGILGIETEPVFPPLRERGWPSVRNLLPVVIKHLYYQTDAEGLVVVADSDHSPLHRAEHEGDALLAEKCRLCILRRVVDRVRSEMRAQPARAPLHVAIGIAVPAIESWYANGIDPHVNEVAWQQGMRDNRYAFSKPGLKKLVYGTERPSLELETRRAVEETRRLCDRIEQLENSFPTGFVPLAAELRRWR